jgi:hydroxyacylglutathione hydrolase
MSSANAVATAYTAGMQIDVLTSGIWQTNTAILSDRGSCIVIDPAYFPRELDAITKRVMEIGQAHAVIFSHGHWDHVMGHCSVPTAPVFVSATLDQAIISNAPRALKYLDDARAFDSRWYVPRATAHQWPTVRRGLHDGESFEFGRKMCDVLQLQGHSPDGLGLLVDGVLLVGDHLSLCEIPFVEDAHAYRTTLRRLMEVLQQGVHEVIPGHGPRHSASAAIDVAQQDLDYVHALIDGANSGDAAFASKIALPRAANVVGMQEQHLNNCANVKIG